jgi:4-hydroxyphenylpyruvate dioxygenase-like putative hemolysin
MSHATALDHVGVVGRDVAALAVEFERLGFCLTPLARHAGGRTGNRNVMLRRGYIELLSVVDGGSSATLDAFLARYAGVHILALAIDDEAATLARLHRAGFPQAAVSQTDRALDDAEPAGPRARFTLVTTPDPPEGRIHLIRHETPAALWQERFLHHPNHTVALEHVVLAVADPAATAARLSRLAGRPVVPDAAGGYALDLARGRVRMLPAGALGAVFADVAAPALPWIAGITLATDDANAALRRGLEERAIPFRMQGDALLTQAGGVWLRFVPA